MIKLTLMNKNIKIINFCYDNDLHLITSIETINENNLKYAPFGLVKNNEIDNIEFNKWWKNRQIPYSRNNLNELLKNNNIYNENNFDLLDIKNYCLSLSDQYWVKQVDEKISWEEINFFDNEFSEDIGKMLFSGEKSSNNINFNSPDMTSNGNYEKRWKIIDGKRYLIKAGSKIFNQEPYNELIATKLYERILDKEDYVKYELINLDKRTVCMCENFLTRETELVPAWQINEYFENKEKNKYEHYINCLKIIGIENAREKINKMLVCDFILANKDRHFNNFGVIRNVETLKFTGVAPIFDNGCSLWYDENDLYVGEFFLTKPFLEYESDQINLVKELDWLDVTKLDGFIDEVKDILSTNKLLSPLRIDKIINEIKNRIEYIKTIISKKNN